MDKINIEGVVLTPLKIIHNAKGDILHGIKKSDVGFIDFGEAYFTTIKKSHIKGWNKHTRMTLNLVVPLGIVTFVLYDGRKSSGTINSFGKIQISHDNYQRLTIPPGVWLAFAGESSGINMVLNIADIEHDPDEFEKVDLDQIDFNWNSI